MQPADDLVKVRFQTDPDGLSGGSPERLWAKRHAGDEAYFQLQNSPFFAKGISYLDVVEATESRDHEGEFEYRRTLSGSGHSTYRILVRRDSSSFAPWWERLATLGCTYEYAKEGAQLLYAVDVPPCANNYEVYGILEDGENHSVWGFDEGHCGHPVRCDGGV